MTTVTVILPVHNGENYLGQSINSVLRQTYSDFILHVLDDCSIDRSADIAQATGDKRVRYSRNPGRYGLFKTLNRGFSEANTPLVRIWAHDDIMLDDSLGQFVRVGSETPSAGLFYCDFYAIDATGARTGAEHLYANQRGRTPRVATPSISAALFLCFGCLPGNISTVMMRRDTWAHAGGFLEGFQQAPDFYMWVRVSEFTNVGFIPEKLIELRDHPLQLGKVGHKQMTTIAEEYMVYAEIRRRLSEIITNGEFQRFWRHHRGRQHVHWIIRALAGGNVGFALKGWGSLRRYRQIWRQLAFWLVSANGRYFTTSAEELFETLHVRHRNHVRHRKPDLVTDAGPPVDRI